MCPLAVKMYLEKKEVPKQGKIQKISQILDHSLSKIESCGIYDSFQSSDFFCICFPGISLELAGVQGLKLMVAYYKLSHEKSNVEPSEALLTCILKPTSPRKVNICSCEKFAWFLVSNY